MPQAPIPHDESERLRALREYDIIGHPPDAVLDALAQAAAMLVGAPMALITLMDVSRQYALAASGFDASDGPRHQSVCSHVVYANETINIPDAQQDARIHDNLWVTGDFNLRAYLGTPLRTEEGHVLGTLCVFDSDRPRQFGPTDQHILEALAEMVMSHLDGRRTQHQLGDVVSECDLGDVTLETMAKLAHTLRPLLNYSAAEMRKQRTFESSLEEPVARIRAAQKEDFKARGNALTTGNLELACPVDHGKVEYVLAQLVRNANRFTEHGVIHVSTRHDDSHAYLIVSDNGQGIDPERLPHLTRFFDSESRDVAGFSLSGCSHLCRSMGASLRITSDLGYGTTVAIVFDLP